jgi:hypothetical protein
MKSDVNQMHIPAIHLPQSPKSGKTRYKRSRNTPQTRSIPQITQSQHKKHTQNHPRMSLDRLKNIIYPFRNPDRHFDDSRKVVEKGQSAETVKALKPDLKIWCVENLFKARCAPALPRQTGILRYTYCGLCVLHRILFNGIVDEL